MKGYRPAPRRQSQPGALPVPETPEPETRDPAKKPPEAAEQAEMKRVSAEALTDDQIALLGVLEPEEAIQVDDLIQRTGIPARRVLSALTMLEIDGCVCQYSGKRYTRTAVLEISE